MKSNEIDWLQTLPSGQKKQLQTKWLGVAARRSERGLTRGGGFLGMCSQGFSGRRNTDVAV